MKNVRMVRIPHPSGNSELETIDFYINDVWHGSRRTEKQIEEYVRQLEK